MNQDYVFASQDTVGNLPNLFAVADGMGGHNAGDYASSHAVRILVDEIREDTDYNPVKVIRHAIETANTEIIEQAQKDEKLRGMGTTMVVATIVGQYAYVANVGDSRLYVVDKPYGGSARFGGTEFSALTPRQISATVGYLGHDPELSADTVQNNVLRFRQTSQ